MISTGASYTSLSGAGGFRVSGIETFRLDWSAGSDTSGRLSVSDDNDTGVTVEIGGHVVRGSGGASALGIGVNGHYQRIANGLELDFSSASAKGSGTEDMNLVAKTP